jgi:hypothetical protein
MANGWTPERRARQAEAIKRWRPWQQLTGPCTAERNAIVSRNADKGGKRAEFRAMLRELRTLPNFG